MFQKLILLSLLATTYVIYIQASESEELLALDCETDEDCWEEFGEDSYFECTPKKICECSEFFVLDPTNSSSCLKGASFSQSCTEDIQCTFILGTSSFCNDTKCACKGSDSEEVAHFDQRCYILKKFGESCTQDLQCMLDSQGNQSSNPLGKCVAGQCGCLNDAMTTSWDSDGACITCEDCTRVEISLFAIMFPSTVALIVFVYGMYRIGSHKKNQ